MDPKDCFSGLPASKGTDRSADWISWKGKNILEVQKIYQKCVEKILRAKKEVLSRFEK